MEETNTYTEIYNLKFALTFAKMILFIIIAFLASIVLIEYSRIKDTRMAMSMFTRIAGDYALTASQEVDNLTNNNSFAPANMYNKYEYGEYLNQLGLVVTSNPNDTSLKYAYDILKQDYDRAVSMTLTSDYLDDNLKYTPMSFNLPYISYSVLKSKYKEAMDMMISNYMPNGSPAIFLMDNEKLDVLRDNSGNTHAMCELSFPAVDTYSYNGLSFRAQELDSKTVKAIYGDESYFSSTVLDVLKSLDTEYYKDPRVTYETDASGNEFVDLSATNSSNTHVLIYDISFTSPYYYVTASRILAFGNKNFIFSTGDSFVDTVNSSNGIHCLSDEAVSHYYDNSFKYKIAGQSIDINNTTHKNQLMFCVSYDAGSLIKDIATATFSYTYLS